MLTFVTAALLAQPSITNFSPSNGPIGTSVTINGAGFSNTPANNIVFFGETRGNITTSTSTQLTVKVPVGATYQPISVTVGGLTGFSNKPFLVTFPEGGTINASSFTSPVGLGPDSGGFGVALGDLDGDGKTDVAVTDYFANSIRIFRNTSTPGTIDVGSFAPSISFGVGINPYKIAIADIDGDGKLDIIASNWNGSTISIFRNTSTVGSLTTSSFAARLDLATGAAPFNISCQDLDGDGKTDIAVGNAGGSSISIWQNIGTPGSITAASFNPRLDIAGPSTGLAIADMDLDGKPDLIAGYNLGSFIGVARNISVPGTLTTGSFAAYVNFAVAAWPEHLVVGDLDGDNLPDIVTSSTPANQISILKNTSTPGTIVTSSFSAAVIINAIDGITEPQGVSITDFDGDGLPDIGLSNQTGRASIYKNANTPGIITLASFLPRVNYSPTGNARDLASGDIDGDGKPDLVVAAWSSPSLVVLRNTVSSLPPPTITNISLTSGPVGTTVIITGTNFSGTSLLNNTVKFNGVTATVLDATSTTITTQVPAGATTGIISVSVGSNTATSGSNFTVTLPTITSFAPTSGPIGTTVIITGFNFNATPSNNIVYFGATKGTVMAATATQLTVTVPASATYAPISVLVGGLTAYSSNPFLVTFPCGGTIDTNSFAPEVDFTSDATDWIPGIAISDFDGDGKPDFAVTNNATNSFSVFRNTATPGLLTTGSFSPYVNFTTGTAPRGIAVGDLDGDGKIDVVVTNHQSHTISVFRNTSATGVINATSFAAKVDFATGFFPNFIKIADLDLDGKPDLVVVNIGSNSISVFKNISTVGAITTSSFAAKVNFTAGTSPYVADIGDLDNDGKPDIVVSNNNSNSISIFKNLITAPGTITTGSFATKVDFTTATPDDVAIGDLDGDGKPEITAANWSNNYVSIFRNVSSTGTINAGSFSSAVQFVAQLTPESINIADLDGDGKPDLSVLSQSDIISIFKNTSSVGLINSGSFATKVDFAAPTIADDAAIGDLDGDGKPDLIISNYNDNKLAVFRNTISSGATPTISNFSPTSGSIGTAVIIIGTNFDVITANNIVKFNGVTATVLASTSTTITTQVPSGATTGTISVSVGCNTATSSGSFTVSPPAIPVITGFIPTGGPIGTTVTITGNNFNTTPANNIVYFGATRGTVTAATSTQITVTVPAGATFQPISVLVNGLVTYARQPFIVNFGCSQIIDASAFAPKVDVTTGLEPYAIALGDFDQDGKTDMATANYSDNTISIFRNTSSGPGNVSYPFKIDFSTGAGRPYALSIGDFDGDGKLDAAVANETTNTVSVFRNTSTGPGNINFAGKIDFATGLFPHGITSTDFNNDGKVDLAVTSNTANVVSVFRNTSSGPGVINFGLRIDFPTGQAAQDVSNGDLDGDGLFDLVVTNYTSNTISVFRNTSAAGSINFAAKVDLPTGNTPNSVSIGDLDGDGKADIAVANAGSNNVSLFRNTSSGVGSIAFAVQADLPVGVGAFWVAMSDLSGDGKPDLAVPDFGNKVAVFQNTSTGAGNIGFATSQDFLTGDTPQAVAIGDLDGDGKADLAVANAFGSSISVLLNLVASLPPPTITGFSPTAGTIGTPVTINGTNFSTTSLNNIVKFNGITATVTASTATSITTTVPVGATTGTITVTVGCTTATSPGNFAIIAVITITTQPSDAIVCIGATATFSVAATGTTNITYQWQFSPDGIVPFADIVNGGGYTDATTPVLSVNSSGNFGAGRYQCRVNGDFATEVITNDEGLFINPLPASPTTIPNSACASSAVILTAAGSTNGNYRWYTVATAGIAIAGEVNSAYTTPPLTNTTLYYVAIYNGTCESIRSSVQATINPTPPAPTVTGTSNCGPGALPLIASGGVNGQYRWYTVSTGGTGIAGAVNSSYSPQVVTSTTNYFVSINDGTCESSRTLVTAAINTIPAAPTTTAGTACGPSATVPVNAAGGTNGSYRWYTSATGGAAIPGAVNGTYNSPVITVTTAYFVSLNNGSCESARTPVNANIVFCNQIPVITPTTLNTQVEGNVTVSLVPFLSDPDNNLDLATLKIVSQPVSGAVATIDKSYSLIVNYAGVKFAGTDHLSIQVCDFSGDCVQQSISVEVVGDIVVFNGISPNGDKQNDLWIIQYIDVLEDTKNNHVSLYNRWGDPVFEADNYDNTNRVFTGLNKSGNELPTGTYFYKIEFASGRATQTGYLSLKR